jgi:Isocitrate/isopropylmalate dehydrogenase
MLQHLGQLEAAEKIANAWRCTIEEGIHTGDIYDPESSKQKVGTDAFADAVIERLGKKPQHLAPLTFDAERFRPIEALSYERPKQEKVLVGSDLFIDDPVRSADELAHKLQEHAGPEFKLKMITNRGVKVYPDGLPETFCTDHWRCRFVHLDNPKDVKQMKPVAREAVPALIQRLLADGIDVVKTENLYYFEGELGFSLGQAE